MDAFEVLADALVKGKGVIWVYIAEKCSRKGIWSSILFHEREEELELSCCGVLCRDGMDELVD